MEKYLQSQKKVSSNIFSENMIQILTKMLNFNSSVFPKTLNYEIFKGFSEKIWNIIRNKIRLWGVFLELSARANSVIFAFSSTAFPFLWFVFLRFLGFMFRFWVGCSFIFLSTLNFVYEKVLGFSFCLHSGNGNSPSTGLGLKILSCLFSDHGSKIEPWGVEKECVHVFSPLV